MGNEFEKRRENRLNYNWPVWFAEDYNHMLSQGQMVNISSEGAAFTCYADKCPHTGEEITARFSVPSHHHENDFDLENFIRKGHVCRIEEIGGYIRKVAIQFAEPLPFKPGEVEKAPAQQQAETFEAYEAAKSAPAGLSKTAAIARDEAIAAVKAANNATENEKSIS
jgi:NAD(P)-dependent dehydrogenase (short-subunit alcohol dehydrogenase family)